MSDRSGGFFSSVGRFFSGGSSSYGRNSKGSPKSEPTDVSSPSTASPAALLRDIIEMDGESAEASNEVIVDATKNRDPSGGLEIEVNSEQDLFFNTPSISSSRKRQLTELDRHALPQSFRSETVKRSRQLNRSLLEPTLKGTLNSERRMDMSWCGELTGNHSPASSVTNFSLLSRHSGATTNGSLSSRTQEIFKRLEDANTPAKEVQRMTMIRAGLTRPESWGSPGNQEQKQDASSTATPPPPLRKAGDAIPSRIQLISKSMGTSARRTPYWTDLTRKRTSSRNGNSGSETSSLRLLNGNLASTELSSVFSLDPPAADKLSSSSSTASTVNSTNKKPHVAILKGPDGKPVGRNTFKLNDDFDSTENDSNAVASLSEATLSKPKPLPLDTESAPKRGFLDNLSFSFSAPKDLVAAVGTAKSASITSSIRSLSESKEEDSDSCESVEKQTSDASSDEDDDSEAEVVDEVKESRPQTSADTISSAGGSSSQSSKDSSPKTAKDPEPTPQVIAAAPVAATSGGKWDCQECFCSWPASDSKCGACGVPRPGTNTAGTPAVTAPQRQLVSNLASFAPAAASGVKFGFGGSSSSTVPAPTNSTTSLFGLAQKTDPVSIAPVAKEVTTIPQASKPLPTIDASAPVASTATLSSSQAPAGSSANGERVAWVCPDCFIPNQATDDKCPCCGHTKYASAASNSNVFGSRAFKPTTVPSSTGTVAFGLSGKSDTSTASAQPVFGLGSTPAPQASTQPSTFLFGTSQTNDPKPIKPEGSLFGIANKPLVSAPAVAAESSAPLFGNKSLFGISKPTDDPKSTVFDKKEPAVTSTATATSISTTPALSNLGSTITTVAGPSSLFGQSKTAGETQKAVSSTFSFGAPSNSSASAEQPKMNIFGSSQQFPLTTPGVSAPSLPSAAPSVFAPSTGSSISSNLFSSKPAESTASSLFGQKQPIQFPSETGTTTTDGGVPAKRGMFSSDAPKLTFGSDRKVEPPTFGGFGGPAAPTSTASATPGSSLFGTNSGSSLFGGPNASNPFAASPNASTTPAFVSSTTIPFGGSTTSSGFGNFNSKPTQPGVSNSSSTSSLFAPADSSNPFGNISTNPSGFNFGGTASSSSSTGQGVFQFGATTAQTNISQGGAFQFGNNTGGPQPTAPGSMDNAFSYQAPSNGGRKMAMARRRNIQRK